MGFTPLAMPAEDLKDWRREWRASCQSQRHVTRSPTSEDNGVERVQ